MKSRRSKKVPAKETANHGFSTFYRERGCESEVKAHMEIFMGYSLLPQGVCVPDVHQLNTTHCVQFIDCENQSTKPKN